MCKVVGLMIRSVKWICFGFVPRNGEISFKLISLFQI